MDHGRFAARGTPLGLIGRYSTREVVELRFVAGEMGWSLLRSGLYALSFMCAMTALGDVRTGWAALCYPEALLVAFAFSTLGMATTTCLQGWRDFEIVMLAMVPMFLFSATFYPLSVYPGWLQAIVRLTPLYQGVALLRGTDLGSFDWAMAGHAAYLAVLGLAGLVATRSRLTRLLLP